MVGSTLIRMPFSWGDMKRAVLLLLLGTGIQIASAAPQGRVGFGFVLGDPTGLTVKYFLDRSSAIDGVLGFAPGDRFRLHGDYLWIRTPFRDQDVSLHYGVGAAIGFGGPVDFDRHRGYFVGTTGLGFAVRIPVGVDYAIPRTPCEVSLELAPLFILAPDAGVGMDLGLGFRFYP
jgi:hypothetical protein